VNSTPDSQNLVKTVAPISLTVKHRNAEIRDRSTRTSYMEEVTPIIEPRNSYKSEENHCKSPKGKKSQRIVNRKADL